MAFPWLKTIDGDKTNNKNTNLLICDNAYHRWLHERMGWILQQGLFGTSLKELVN